MTGSKLMLIYREAPKIRKMRKIREITKITEITEIIMTANHSIKVVEHFTHP